MKRSIYRKIMVAADGSESAKKAVDTAIEIAKLSEAKLYAVHVVSLGFYLITHSIDPVWKKEIEEQLLKEGKEATAYVESAGRAANIEVESVILRGNPAEEILGFEDRNEIDLVVIGTHGMTGISRFLLGSVAENVVRHAKKAVLVVRGEAAEKSG
jgi:nucleotide-binding universal stress UspA family protein